jgi:hypothetical protein
MTQQQLEAKMRATEQRREQVNIIIIIIVDRVYSFLNLNVSI